MKRISSVYFAILLGFLSINGCKQQVPATSASPAGTSTPNAPKGFNAQNWSPTVEAPAPSAPASLQAMLSEKNGELKGKGQVLLTDLDTFQTAIKACQTRGLSVSPVLSDEEIANFKSIGADRIGEALALLPGPAAPTSVSEVPTTTAPAAVTVTETAAATDTTKRSWYSDQTNWGILNMLAAIGVIGGAMVMSRHVDPKLAGKLSDHFANFEKLKPHGTPEEFKTYLKDNVVEIAERDSMTKEFDEATQLASKKATLKTTIKFSSLLLGSGMLVGGALMTAAGFGAFDLAGGTDACDANGTLMKQLYALKDEVAALKSAISLLTFQIEQAHTAVH